jgi:alpha-D-xyloside xylohydrolase
VNRSLLRGAGALGRRAAISCSRGSAFGRRAAIALLIPLTACSGGDTTPGSDDAIASSIDLPSGAHVDLFRDGSIQVLEAGEAFIRRGKSIFGVFRGDRSQYHDPSTRDEFTFDPIDASAIKMSTVGQSVRFHLADQGKDGALVAFSLPTDRGLYLGLGERFDHVDTRGRVIPMYLTISNGNLESGTNDAHVPVPFVVDTRGYGIFVDSPATGAFDVGASDNGTLSATFDQTDLDVRLYLPASAAPVDVVAAYLADTELPRRPPLWSLAPMHWRNEWADAATLLGDLDAYRTRHIPASTVWIDNPWQTSYNDATLDPARFGDPKALMDAIAAKGFRTIAWSTPYLDRPAGKPQNDAQQLFEQANAKGYFVKSDGKTWYAIGCCVKGPGMIDFTSPAASAFWEGVLARATGAGFAGFKLDYAEDLIPSLLGVRLGVQLADGETERTARTYPVRYHDAYEAALAKVRQDGFVIGRASSAGGAAHVDAIWPGDLDNGFELRTEKRAGGLPAAIVAGQSLAASGFPTFGSDIGGFRDGAPTREALLRWAEYAAFGVIMQLGGGGDSHNPWAYDEEAATIYGGLAHQHMQLVPYLDAILRDAAENGAPSIRSLPLQFPTDEAGFAFADSEYLLGPSLLVAPIVEEGATGRWVHLPPGDWTHWFDGAHVAGPVDVAWSAPLGEPPVFAIANALVPLFNRSLDTVVPTTEAGIADLDAGLDYEARWFPKLEGADFSERSSCAWPTGDTLDAEYFSNELHLTFKSADARGVFVTIDLEPSGELTPAAGVTVVAGEAEARASKKTVFAASAHRDRVWVRIAPGSNAVTLFH